jgi:hypothetical protein
MLIHPAGAAKAPGSGACVFPRISAAVSTCVFNRICSKTFFRLNFQGLCIRRSDYSSQDDAGPPVKSEGLPAIVAFGGGLTAGYGLTEDQRFTTLLQRKIDEKGIVFAWLTRGCLARA